MITSFTTEFKTSEATGLATMVAKGRNEVDRKKTLRRGYDHSRDFYQNHIQIAREFARKLGWSCTLVGVSLSSSLMAWSPEAFITRTDVYGRTTP